MLQKLMFVSRTSAENMPGWASGAIISITVPEAKQAKLMHGWYAIHRAIFHDIDIPSKDKVNAACDREGGLAMIHER